MDASSPAKLPVNGRKPRVSKKSAVTFLLPEDSVTTTPAPSIVPAPIPAPETVPVKSRKPRVSKKSMVTFFLPEELDATMSTQLATPASTVIRVPVAEMPKVAPLPPVKTTHWTTGGFRMEIGKHTNPDF